VSLEIIDGWERMMYEEETGTGEIEGVKRRRGREEMAEMWMEWKDGWSGRNERVIRMDEWADTCGMLGTVSLPIQLQTKERPAAEQEWQGA